MRFQIGTSSETYGGRRFLPYAFTEQGVAMLSAILRSEIAIKVSLQIMNAFVSMRKLIRNSMHIEYRLTQLEIKNTETDQKFNHVFDAYLFVSNLVRSAKSSIILFDNYVDDSILTLLDKRENTVKATIIYAKN